MNRIHLPRYPFAAGRRMAAMMSLGLLLATSVRAIQTQEVELGRDGNYDGRVLVTRDAEGRLTFRDAELTTAATLAELRQASLDATSTPTFAGLILTGLASGSIPYVGSGGALRHDPLLNWSGSGRRLGIGTAAPFGTLHVKVDQSARLIISDDDSQNSNSPKLSFFGSQPNATFILGPSIQKVGASAYGVGDLVIWQHAGGDYTNEFEALRVTSAGNLGIGTVPSTRLDVNGGARLRGALQADGTLRLAPGTQEVASPATALQPTAAVLTLAPTASHTITALPSIAAGADGQILLLVNTHASRVVRLQDETLLAGTTLRLAAPFRDLGESDLLTLLFIGGRWCEASFSDN